METWIQRSWWQNHWNANENGHVRVGGNSLVSAGLVKDVQSSKLAL